MVGNFGIETPLPDTETGGYWAVVRMCNRSTSSQWIEFATQNYDPSSLYIRTSDSSSWKKLI